MADGTGTTADEGPITRRLSLVVSQAQRAADDRAETRRVRLMILDRDRELVRALAGRAGTRGWESHVLGKPTTRRLLARMKIDVLLVDPAVIDSDPWRWLERIASGLPGLAVVICAGPSTVTERVRALEFVDDWLSKPVHPDEVIARVERAVQRRRRADGALTAPAAHTGELELRVQERRVLVAGVDAHLTPREFEVLHVLTDNQGVVVERGEIFARVWGYAMVSGDRSVDVHVRKIRAKLALVSPAWSYIHTQFRIGYRFQPERERG
jgi:DNA-binding response OmpR family regulator